MWKKAVALLLTLCLVGTMIVPTMAAKETTEQVKTAVFLGDSLSAGFQMGFGLNAAYDYSVCLTQDKTTGASNYYWAYPFQFGELVYGEDKYSNDGNGKIERADRKGNYVDNEVQQSILNYGISGAQSEDMRCLLSGEDLPANSAVNMLRQGFINAEDDKFYAKMRDNVGTAEMTAIAVGGNDIYQNFANGFQTALAFTDETMMVPKNLFGYLTYMISNQLMMAQPIGGIVEMFKGMLNPAPYPYPAEQNDMALQGGEDAAYSGAMGFATANLGAQLLEFLSYYSKKNITSYFMDGKNSILNQWKKSYQGIVNQVAQLQKDAKNEDGQIVLISQFNPFGTQNYLTMMEERLTSNEFLSIFKEDAITAGRVVRTLLSELTKASVYQVMNPTLWQSKTADAFEKALGKLLPLDLSIKYICSVYTGEDPFTDIAFTFIDSDWKDHVEWYGTTVEHVEKRLEEMNAAYADPSNWSPYKENEQISYAEYMGLSMTGTPIMPMQVIFDMEDDAALYQLLGDLAYPMMVAMIGGGLQPVYKEMNAFIKGLADASDTDNIVYVDISDAPSNGRFDPHPGVDEHTWIAQRIYEQLVEINGGTAFKGGNFKGESAEEEPTTPTYREYMQELVKKVMSRTASVFAAAIAAPFLIQRLAPAANSVFDTLMALTGNTNVLMKTEANAPVLSAEMPAVSNVEQTVTPELPAVDMTDAPAFTALMTLAGKTLSSLRTVTASVLGLPAVDLTDAPAFTALMKLSA